MDAESAPVPPGRCARRLTGRSAILILIYGASLLGLKLGEGRVLTRHEVLAAVPAREMLASGDRMLPTFCRAACDANDDDQVDISDASALLTFLFLGGLEPPPPIACLTTRRCRHKL